LTGIWRQVNARGSCEWVESSVHLFVVRLRDAELIETWCWNPKDDKFLELAYDADADAIVTSDGDLLELNP